MFLYSRVIDSQKFVTSSRHVDIVWLTFCAFTVKELIYWVICHTVLQQEAHDLYNLVFRQGRSQRIHCLLDLKQIRRCMAQLFRSLLNKGFCKSVLWKRGNTAFCQPIDFICFVGLYFTDGVVTEVMYEFCMDYANIKTWLSKESGDGLVVFTGKLHNDEGFAFQAFERACQFFQFTGSVTDFKGFSDGFSKGAHDDDRAFPL